MVGTFNPEIAIVNATLADILLLSGYLPKRWRKRAQCGVTKAGRQSASGHTLAE